MTKEPFEPGNYVPKDYDPFKAMVGTVRRPVQEMVFRGAMQIINDNICDIPGFTEEPEQPISLGPEILNRSSSEPKIRSRMGVSGSGANVGIDIRW